jgi:hypothetical protein
LLGALIGLQPDDEAALHVYERLARRLFSDVWEPQLQAVFAGQLTTEIRDDVGALLNEQFGRSGSLTSNPEKRESGCNPIF